jgi:hypothetical protein
MQIDSDQTEPAPGGAAVPPQYQQALQYQQPQPVALHGQVVPDPNRVARRAPRRVGPSGCVLPPRRAFLGGAALPPPAAAVSARD